MKFKTKQKKGQGGGMWWMMAVIIVALLVAGISIFIFKKEAFAGQKNIEFLSSCKNQGGGECRESCSSTETAVYRYGGCPPGEKVGDTKDDPGEKIYCCIPKEKK